MKKKPVARQTDPRAEYIASLGKLKEELDFLLSSANVQPTADRQYSARLYQEAATLQDLAVTLIATTQWKTAADIRIREELGLDV